MYFLLFPEHNGANGLIKALSREIFQQKKVIVLQAVCDNNMLIMDCICGYPVTVPIPGYFEILAYRASYRRRSWGLPFSGEQPLQQKPNCSIHEQWLFVLRKASIQSQAFVIQNCIGGNVSGDWNSSNSTRLKRFRSAWVLHNFCITSGNVFDEDAVRKFFFNAKSLP